MKRYLREEMDNLLKEKSDQYLLYPSDEVWNKIQKELHPNLRWRYASIILILLFSASIAVFIKKEEIAKATKKEEEKASKISALKSVMRRGPRKQRSARKKKALHYCQCPSGLCRRNVHKRAYCVNCSPCINCEHCICESCQCSASNTDTDSTRDSDRDDSQPSQMGGAGNVQDELDPAYDPDFPPLVDSSSESEQ